MGKLVNCKTCGKEIAKSAKRCPHCGARTKKHHFFRNLIVLILIIFVGIPFLQKYTDIDSIRLLKPITNFVNTAITHKRSNDKSEDSKPTSAVSNTNTSDDKSNNSKHVESTEVSKELKDFLDSYETFMNEYCEFIETYDSNDTSMVAKYLELVQKEVDFAEKADAYNQDEMSDSDLKYYLETTARIEVRLLEAASKVK